MRDILNFKGRIKPLMELSMKFMEKRPELFVMQDTVQALQMSTYFIQEAAELTYQSNKKEDIIHEGDRLFPMETPEVESEKGLLVCIFNIIDELIQDIYKLMTEVPLPQLAQMWLTYAIGKLSEAKFSVEITSIQHERIQTPGGTNLLSH